MASQRFTILFSSIGRRVALVDAFRRALECLGLEGRILGADSSPLSPALELADARFVVPPCIDPAFVPRLLEICRDERVDMVVPLIDTELPVLADRHAAFREAGTRLCLSSPEAVAICEDKVRTHDTLADAGVDTPRLFDPAEVTDADFPLLIKPRDGSSAIGVRKLDSRRHLEFYTAEYPDSIVQEFIDGQEYTLDIFADADGEPRSAVPRKRIEIRGGEVTKSMTVLDAELIEAGFRAVRAIGGCLGPITLQCFKTAEGRISVIEINPRLGGGVPLAIEAGADIPAWTIELARGRRPRIDADRVRDRLVMLRYDEAVFRAEDELAK